MLAIIIPYYKLTFFKETLESLGNQTDKRFKVYIGDDASPENPVDLLEKYRGKFDFVYHRFENNLGGTSLTQQWERCVALSENEEWIMILGDDDLLGENVVEEFYRNLSEIKREGVNVVRYATKIDDEKKQNLSQLYLHPKLEKATDFFYRRLVNQTRSSLSEYVFKRSIYKKYGFYDYDLAWHSDDRAWFDFSEFKYIYSINTSYVIFRLSEFNISRGNFKTRQKQESSLKFYKYIINKHLFKFKNYQKKALLLYYEQLVYKNKQADFFFWLSTFLLFVRSFYFIQGLKFTRRLLIHLKHVQFS